MKRSGPAAVIFGSLLLLLLSLPPHTAATQFETPLVSLVDRYEQAVAADPGNLTLHYHLGIALLETGDYSAALRELQTAYPAYLDSIEAHYNLGVAAARLRDYDSASIYMDMAEALGAKAFPEVYPLADFYFNLALYSREQGRPEDAVRYFLRVLEFAPNRTEVYRQLGDLYAQQGDTDAALQAFQTYLEYFPEDPVSLEYVFSLEYNRAHDHLAHGDYDEAEAGFRRALALNPESPTIHYYLGYIRYNQGNLVEAVPLLQGVYPNADENLREAIRPLLYNCSLTLRKTGQPGIALQALGPVADSEMASFNELYLAGSLALSQGENRLAQSYLARAAALQPGNDGVLQNLVVAEQRAFDEWLLLARGAIEREEFPLAEEALQSAATLYPEDHRLPALRNRITAARLAAAAKSFATARQALAAADYQTAEQAVTQGLAIEPDNATGLALRNQIVAGYTIELQRRLSSADGLLGAGQWEQAEALYTEILAIEPGNQNAQTGLAQARYGLTKDIDRWLETGHNALDNGALVKAQEAFEHVIALEPEHPNALDGLAAIADLRENLQSEYLHNGRQAMERNRFDDARNWFDQAWQVQNSTQVREEINRLEEVIASKADALADEAMRARKSRRYAQAETLYTRALQIKPDHKRSSLGLQELAKEKTETITLALDRATQALQNGSYAVAMSAYRQILDQSPENQDAITGLQRCRSQAAAAVQGLLAEAKSALEQGNLKTADQQLAKALQIDAYHRDAQALRQRLDQLKAVGARPEDEQNLYLQGVSHYTQGRYQEAIKAWETVLIINPEHNKARQNIEKTRHKLQQIEEYRGG